MAQAFTKYNPDPSKPVTVQHARLLQSWGLWEKAKARGVRVLKETDETSQGSAQDDPKDDDKGKAQGDPSKAAETDPADEDEDPYDEWSVEELREELSNRKLAKGGNKEELIARLEKDDEAKAK